MLALDKHQRPRHDAEIMARPLRIEIADGIYHVTGRVLAREDIARDDKDQKHWLDQLDAVVTRLGWRVFAWVLMSNHFHLFLTTPEPNLSRGMHDLNAGYVNWYNTRHRRRGPLFQGRFYSILVEREYHYWELTRYIHLNPVRAGMVEQPQEYPWSSCLDYLSNRRTPDWLAKDEVLAGHGRTMRAAMREYRGFLREGIRRELPSPFENLVASTLLGSEAFVRRMRQEFGDEEPDVEVPASGDLRPDITPNDVIALTAREYGISESDLCVQGRHNNEPRRVAIHLCRRMTRASLSELGRIFGNVRGQALSYPLKQIRRRLEEDAGLHREVARIEAGIREEWRSGGAT